MPFGSTSHRARPVAHSYLFALAHSRVFIAAAAPATAPPASLHLLSATNILRRHIHYSIYVAADNFNLYVPISRLLRVLVRPLAWVPFVSGRHHVYFAVPGRSSRIALRSIITPLFIGNLFISYYLLIYTILIFRLFQIRNSGYCRIFALRWQLPFAAAAAFAGRRLFIAAAGSAGPPH